MNKNTENQPEDFEEVEIENKIREQVEAEAFKKAQKFVRKNTREIKRLRKHAEDALFDGNKARYVYAIKKMRDMLKQPYTDEMIDVLWKTSLNQLRDLYAQASQKFA